MSKHQVQPEYGERAGWRGTGRPNLSRETKFSGANGDREILFFLVQLTTSRIGNLTRLRSSTSQGSAEPLCARIKGANREVSAGKADV